MTLMGFLVIDELTSLLVSETLTSFLISDDAAELRQPTRGWQQTFGPLAVEEVIASTNPRSGWQHVARGGASPDLSGRAKPRDHGPLVFNKPAERATAESSVH